MSDDTSFLAMLLHHYEQTGAGVRELNARLKRAATDADYHQIAAEAHRRSTQEHLPPSIETAYQVLAMLAQRRAAGEDVDRG